MSIGIRGETAPSRLRRALAAAWTFAIFAVLPLAGLGVLAGGLNSFDLADPSMQGVIDAALEAARVLIAINALARGMLAPGARPGGSFRSAIGRREFSIALQ